MHTTTTASHFSARSSRRQSATLALLAFAMLIVSLDQYIVVVALPEIGRDLGYSAQSLQSVISAYAVASAGFLLLGGRAADLLGRRRMFVAGLALYAGASLAGGLATTAGVPARRPRRAGPRRRARASRRRSRSSTRRSPRAASATARWRSGAAPARPASCIGVLLGGVLTQALGWEAVFFVNVPLAGLAALLAFVLIAADRRRETRPHASTCPARSAPRSASPCSCSRSSRARSSAGTRPRSSAARPPWLLFLAALVIDRADAVAIRSCPRRLLANRNLDTAIAIAFLFMATFGSVLYFLSLYFQDVRGYDALETGVGVPAPDRRSSSPARRSAVGW